MILLITILVIFIISLFEFLRRYNKLLRLKHNVQQSKSGINVYLQQRFDLIPNLISTVKGYINYESETLKKIIQLRYLYYETKDTKVSEELNNQISKLMLILENYPNLKADEQFLSLQKALLKVESQIQAARRIYNNDVTIYNTKIEIIPDNIIAKLFKFEKERLFQIDEDASKNISIKL